MEKNPTDGRTLAAVAGIIFLCAVMFAGAQIGGQEAKSPAKTASSKTDPGHNDKPHVDVRLNHSLSFVPHNVKPEERLSMLKKKLDEWAASQGKFYEIKGLSLSVQPLQPPAPPPSK